MHIEQFVMAYGVEHDRIRALLPDGFTSIRPVLRINAEIRDGKTGYLEFNTAVEKNKQKGWLNIACWEDMAFYKQNQTTVFKSDFLTISFTKVGVEGSCPAENDNVGCYFLQKNQEYETTKYKEYLRKAERITANKEFCDCSFAWHFAENDAHGASIGKTLPAVCEEINTVYPREKFTAENAAAIQCRQVLGSYAVCFERQ